MTAALPRIPRWTGMPEDWVAARRGRIDATEYRRELLRDRSDLLSGYYGTITAPDPDPLSLYPAVDPGLDGVVAPLTTAFLSYAERDLRWQGEERRYELLNGDLSRRWSYGGGRDQGLDRKSVVVGKCVSVRVDVGGRRCI